MRSRIGGNKGYCESQDHTQILYLFDDHGVSISNAALFKEFLSRINHDFYYAAKIANRTECNKLQFLTFLAMFGRCLISQISVISVVLLLV